MDELKIGSKGEEVRRLKVALNRRLDNRGFAALKVSQKDATLRTSDMRSVVKAAWALGAQRVTLDRMENEDVVPIGVQRMIRNPGRRSPTQQQLGKVRIANMRRQRKLRAAAKAKESRDHGGSNRSKAVNAFLAKVGTKENPTGSNGGGIITVMETYWGFGRVPWCGISAGYHAEKFGGVDLKSDVASVQAITSHAKAGNNPYGKFQSDPGGALPGSFVIIGGPGTHVGMLVEAIGGGRARTVEGNTSFGPGGSQSNGGCIAARVRSDSEIYGVATMNFPG